ncbi:MAG: hypothetical protein U0235_34090 [Polyangiaceae bacterium]
MDANRVMRELDDLFAELETLLKNPDVGATLAERGVNVSLALLASDALKAYVHGDKARAAEEFCHFGEEVAARLAVAKGTLS